MNDDLPALAARIDLTNELLTRMLAEVAKTPSTHAIFVDAGYLYAAAGRLVAGTEDRRAFDLDAEGLIEALIDRARSIFADSRLLRVYWYDGARRRIHTTEQQSIAELPDVKVRLGNLNANNQQKGVDSLIRSDLESLARHRAISDAALLGGDEDLVSAVEAAQGYGARVHLWGIEAPEGRNQAEPLLWEVDSQRTLDLDFFKPYVARRTAQAYETNGASRPTREAVRFMRRADRGEVARGPGQGVPGGTAAGPPLPPRLRRPGPPGRGRGHPAVLPARPGGPATLTARRLLGARADAVLELPLHRIYPGWLSQKSARARAVGKGWSRLGECSASGTTVRCARRSTAISSRRLNGQVSSTAPDRTWNGSGTAASSATRFGAVHNWRPVARSWAWLVVQPAQP